VPPSRCAHDVPPGFDAIVARAMSRNPRHRFPSLRAFGTALLPLASDRARCCWSAEFTGLPADSRVRKRSRPKNVATLAVTETVDSARAPVLPEVAPPKKGKATVLTYDGVALASRGDVVTILWKAPARILRARWLFDHMDRIVADQPEGVLTLMIILPTSAPPDRATSVESAARTLKLRAATRKAAVVILGESLWQSVAKAILRAFMPWSSSRLVFAGTVDEGLVKLMKGAGTKTPKPAAIERDVRALYAALDPTLANEG
jgi:hypothetical protein